MKKILLVFSLLVAFGANAQTNDNELAMQLVTKNSNAIGLSKAELSNLIVSSSYFDKSAAVQRVYLLQSYQGLPVYNQMLVLTFKNEMLISHAGEFNHSLEKFVNVKTAVPLISAVDAVHAAVADRKLQAGQLLLPIKSSNDGSFIEFNKMGVSRENITAQLMWVPVEKNNTVRLAWQVYIIPATTVDYWLVRIDATNNSTLGVDNLTNYDNWGQSATTGSVDHALKNNSSIQQTSTTVNTFNVNAAGNSPSVVNGALYRVVPFPAESPQAPGGTPALISNPWTAAPGNATSLKWHTGAGAVDYNYTRGNNVWAYQDRLNDNTGTAAESANSTTASDPLSFDFVPNFTVDPVQSTPVQNQQFNTTNLFYWNNIVHDVMYQYGFDEAAGNFQDDNQGRGGTGNDHVNAEAQDGGGTNNANFSTPNDGTSGRMQMYLWNIGSPAVQKDGDVDNGVVVHEYGHGISNRLTGGPANSACLNNAEQMGEGWSDIYALLFTQDWAGSNLNSGFSSPRGIGLYALSNTNLFGTSLPNTGIRHYKYSTDMSVNPLVYLSTLPSSPHDRGEIWCATLWDMTWNIINQTGVINPNIYDASGVGGNIIAFKLITEGLKLQQCSPGFISGRNAILQADQNLYGGAYHCAILSAFARRGMGLFASEGSTSIITDQVVDYTGGLPGVLLNQGAIPAVAEGQNIVYNNVVNGQCFGATNYTLRDTLPSNVTFVSATNGGTYNAGNRVVSWTVNLAAGAIDTYSFTVNINSGTYYLSSEFINEPVAAATIPVSWTTTSTTANVWATDNIKSHSAPNSFFSPDAAVVSDQIIATTASISLGAVATDLSFWHWYNTESTFDGAVLEISTNGGTTWADIGASNFTKNGYNATISTQFSSPIGGRAAWSGNSAAFIQTKVSLAAYANQPNVKLRWRMASDASVASTGWNVDDILVQEAPPVINMRSSLFDNADQRISLSDTTTLVLAPLPAITATAGPNGTISDPGISTVTLGSDKTYTITANSGYNIQDVLVDAVSQGAMSTYTFTNVITNHTISASFVLGCSVTGSGTTTPVSCAGNTNGTSTITLTGAGAAAPGTYTVDGGPSQAYSTNPFTITGLAAGNHTVFATVTAGGCISSGILINVGAPAGFTATYTKTNVSSCSGLQDGSITVTPTGGTGPYTYSWNGITGSGNPATTVFTAGNVSALTGLNYGYYNVSITDAGGCGIVNINNIHVELGYTVYVTYSGSNSSSCANTGSVLLYGNAGIQPYTYSLTGLAGSYQASNTFSNLAAGTYTGYVKDARGCISTKPGIVVSAAAAITVTAFVRNASSCGNDGAVEIYRSGGIPSYTYSITSAAGPWVSTNIFTALAAGSYTAYVKDAAGCVGQQAVVVAAGAGVSITASKINTSTCVNDGSIQLNATGGIAPYAYSKDNGITFQASNSFSGLGQGNYPIVVKDSKGCTGASNVTINLNTIVVTASAVNASTCASNNGKISVFRTGGYNPYTYSLDGNTYQSGNVFLNVAPGIYTAYVKDAKTCIGTISNIEVGPTGCIQNFTAGKDVRSKSSEKIASVKMQLYPNPSATEFTLLLQDNSSKEKVFITLTDVLGRKVYQTTTTEKQLNLGKELKAGIYIMEVVQARHKQIVKLIKE